MNKNKLLKLTSIFVLGGSMIELVSILTTSCGNKEVEVIDIELNTDIFSMLPNQQLKLIAAVLPENATDKSVT